jgi:membrane protease YdiL (CAAX protease family)
MEPALVPLRASSQAGTGLARLARQYPLRVFFVLAYLFAWICFLPAVLGEGGFGIVHIKAPVKLFLLLGGWAPTVAALCTQWLGERNLRILHFYSSWKTTLLGSIAALALAMLAIVVLPAIVLSKASPLSLHWSALISLPLYTANPALFVGGPLSEEPGWRGFALPRLQARFGALPGSLLLGVLWAAWHLPLFLVPAWAGTSLWSFFIYVISVSILITWGTNLSGLSILAPVLMHATSNISTVLMNALFKGLPMRQHDEAIYLGVVVFAALAVIALTRGRLGFKSPTSP